MKRLLCIVGTLDAGGAETFLMKILRNIDRTEYILDFCVLNSTKGFYADEVSDLGGKIFRAAPKSRHPVRCFCDIRHIVKENNYEYVIRVNEHSLSVIDLIAAKMGGAKVLAMRSSNADSPGRFSKVLHKVFSFLPKLVPTVKVAPSTEAAEYTFGRGCVEKGRAHLLHNGLEHSIYRFDSDNRNAIRAEFGIEDRVVIGHVGRFSAQKNHSFLIDVFESILKKNDNAVLMLVGIGGLEESIRSKVHSLGLDDKVIFAGRRSDVPRILSAFDVLLMPSLYEGMPNVVIEAQASGLPCVISDTITPEADITGLVEYVPLSVLPDVWSEKVIEAAEDTVRRDTFNEFEKEGYELSAVTEKFVQLIFGRETK